MMEAYEEQMAIKEQLKEKEEEEEQKFRKALFAKFASKLHHFT